MKLDFDFYVRRASTFYKLKSLSSISNLIVLTKIRRRKIFSQALVDYCCSCPECGTACPQIWLCTVAARVGWACHASLDYRQIWLLTIISEHNQLPHFSPDRQTTVSLKMSPTIGWCSQSQSGVGQTPLLLPNYGAFSKLDPTINIRPSRPIILTAHKDLASLASNFLQQLNQKSGFGNDFSPPSKEKSYIKRLKIQVFHFAWLSLMSWVHIVTAIDSILDLHSNQAGTNLHPIQWIATVQ